MISERKRPTFAQTWLRFTNIGLIRLALMDSGLIRHWKLTWGAGRVFVRRSIRMRRPMAIPTSSCLARLLTVLKPGLVLIPGPKAAVHLSLIPFWIIRFISRSTAYLPRPAEPRH